MKTSQWLGACLLVGGFAFMGGLSVSTRTEPPRACTAPVWYSDQIRLPVEAFGAHWRIQNFRKNVLFPDGFDDAFPRAVAASDWLNTAMDRPATITIAPRTYRLRSTIYIDGAIPLKVEGFGSGRTELRNLEFGHR